MQAWVMMARPSRQTEPSQANAKGLQLTCPAPLGAMTDSTLDEEDVAIWRRASWEGDSVCQCPLKRVVDNVPVDADLPEPDSQDVWVRWAFLAISLRNLTPNAQAVNALTGLEESKSACSRTPVLEKVCHVLKGTPRELGPSQVIAESGGSRK